MEKLKLRIETVQETRNKQILRLIKFICECVGGINSNLSTKIANLDKIQSEIERKAVAEDIYSLFDTTFTKILKEYKLNKLPIKAYQIAERENIKSLFLEDQESEFIFLFPSNEDASISLNRILNTLDMLLKNSEQLKDLPNPQLNLIEQICATLLFLGNEIELKQEPHREEYGYYVLNKHYNRTFSFGLPHLIGHKPGFGLPSPHTHLGFVNGDNLHLKLS